MVSIDEWRRIIETGSRAASFVGVDERAYPQDFAVFARYYESLVDAFSVRYPLPAALTWMNRMDSCARMVAAIA